MTGKMYWQFISTFVMGAITGAFLYVTAFAPAYEKDLATAEADVSGVVIEGEMYGGCSEVDSCASFRLQENRRFDYIPYPDTAVEHGKLPTETAAALFEALDEATLAQASSPHTSNSCLSYTDGLDFTYTISGESAAYTLDTCTTKLAADAVLRERFVEVWNFMQNPTTTYPEILEKGIGEYIIDKTFERFHEAGKQTQ